MALDQKAENMIVPGQGLRRVMPLSLVSAIGFSGKMKFENILNLEYVGTSFTLFFPSHKIESIFKI